MPLAETCPQTEQRTESKVADRDSRLPEGREFIFGVTMRRYKHRSTMVNSNRPIQEWGKFLQDVPRSTAILGREILHAEVVTMKGRSCRPSNRAIALAADSE